MRFDNYKIVVIKFYILKHRGKLCIHNHNTQQPSLFVFFLQSQNIHNDYTQKNIHNTHTQLLGKNGKKGDD